MVQIHGSNKRSTVRNKLETKGSMGDKHVEISLSEWRNSTKKEESDTMNHE